jgi:hypothetical protein
MKNQQKLNIVALIVLSVAKATEAIKLYMFQEQVEDYWKCK